MTFPYPINVNIPNSPNDPADDQPEMKKNYANTAGFLQVDHVAAGTNPGAGFHKQVTYNSPNIPAAIVSPTISVGFTADAANLGGRATNRASPIVQEFFRNQNGIFPTMGVRAFGNIQVVFGGNPTPQTINNAFNVTSVNRTTPGVYLVVLENNCTNSTFYSVVCTSAFIGVNLIPGYAITAPNSFTIRFYGGNGVAADPNQFSFLVLET